MRKVHVTLNDFNVTVGEIMMEGVECKIVNYYNVKIENASKQSAVTKAIKSVKKEFGKNKNYIVTNIEKDSRKYVCDIEDYLNIAVEE